MLANSEYEFTLFVSQKNYSSKPTQDEMPKMRVVPQQLTIESALECATQGIGKRQEERKLHINLCNYL